MFTSVIGTTLTLQSFAICFIASVICGLMTAFAYKLSYRTTQNYLSTTALLPVIVMTVIMMVNGNLGIGIAIAGSFSLIRFRSLPGRASDIGGVFLSMVAGLACGTGYAAFAILITALACLLMILLAGTGLFKTSDRNRYIRIHVPEDMEFEKAFSDALGKYTDRHDLIGCKTSNLGSIYELTYDVRLKDSLDIKEMIDELRVLNGNLSVNVNTNSPAQNEL